MHPWQRQPHESPADFTAFVAYLRLKGRRSHRTVAVSTGRSVSAIRRLSVRFDWPARVAAFEARLAAAAESALAAAIANSAAAGLARSEQMRRDQFQLAQDLLRSAQRWLALSSRPNRRLPSPTQIARLVELASRLSRLVAGMPTGEEKQRRRNEDAPGYWTQLPVEAALEKIYGLASPLVLENKPAAATPPGGTQSATDRAQPSPDPSPAPPPWPPPDDKCDFKPRALVIGPHGLLCLQPIPTGS
jgi:hypothetical protein